MKNASQIINFIQNRPQFSKLSKYKCIKKIQSIFTPAVQKMIKFAYIKNNILFFVLNHPAGKQEFDNNIQSIKSALKLYKPDECKEIILDDIRAFVTHTPKIQIKSTIIKKEIYKERSLGNFEVNVKDEKLSELIKSIKDIIKG